MNTDICPPLGELAVYLDGRASEAARQRVDRHLVACAPCARIVTDARAFFGEAFSTTRRMKLPAPRRSREVRRSAFLAAATLAGAALLAAAIR